MKTAMPQPGLILAIDLGKYKSVAYLYESATAEVRFRTNAAELLDLLERQHPAVVLIETGASAGWVYDLCTAAKVPCPVANTASEAWKFQHSKRKTDRDDARPRGTEEFRGRDTLVSQSSMPRQTRARTDPVNLFGATNERTLLFERLRRPKSASASIATVSYPKKREKRQRPRCVLLTFEAVNLFGAASEWTPAFERLRRPKEAKSVNRHGELPEKSVKKRQRPRCVLLTF
jgi:hypothetical protein